jgi:hypothetical protein
MVTATPSIAEAASRLVRYHQEADPDLQRIYLFPADDQVRLVEVAGTVLPTHDGEATAFYFGSVPAHGIPIGFGIAMIRPEEDHQVRPPDGWGDWSDALLIWQRS